MTIDNARAAASMAESEGRRKLKDAMRMLTAKEDRYRDHPEVPWNIMHNAHRKLGSALEHFDEAREWRGHAAAAEALAEKMGL